MKRYRNISIILFFLLLLSVGFLWKQSRGLNKVEHAVYDVGISSAIVDYGTSPLADTLKDIIDKEQITLYQDNSSIIADDFHKLYQAYKSLYRYYGIMGGDNGEVENHLQEVLQDFQTFFDYLVINYENDAIESNDEKGMSTIPLRDEAYEGSKIIATVMENLETIRSDVYKNKSTDDRVVWKTLVIKNEAYAKTDKVRQNSDRIQQIIKMWSK